MNLTVRLCSISLLSYKVSHPVVAQLSAQNILKQEEFVFDNRQPVSFFSLSSQVQTKSSSLVKYLNSSINFGLL